jgi:hypothetical protein
MYTNHRRFENVVPLARFVIGISVVVFIAGACIFYVWSCNEIDRGGREIKKLENRLAELQNQNEVMRGRVSILSSMDTLGQSFKNGSIKLETILQYEPAYRIAGDDEDIVRPISNSNRSPRP